MTSNPLVPVPAAEAAEEASETARRRKLRPSNEEIATWLLMGAAMLLVLRAHLVAPLIGGLILYLILDRLALWFSRHMPHAAARPLALILVTLVGGGFIVGSITFAVSFLRHHMYRIPAMMTEMANILQSTRAYLGSYGDQVIPDVLTDADNIKGALVEWLKTHADALKLAGGNISLTLVRMVLGMILAILVFFRHVTHHDEELRGSLARCMAEKVDRFADAFLRIAVAQFKISTLTTFVVALYLSSLPLFGIHMPFVTTLILITFICGFIPVLGSLVSNTVIVILSLGVSVGTALASLIFGVIANKLQYVIQSRIVGSEIDAQAWEILLAIILGEATFGIAGVIMAPVIYAFTKRELRERGLV